MRSRGTAALVLGSLLFFLTPFLHYDSVLLHAVDFKTVYGSSRCLLHHCNPYDSAQIEQEYAKGGGDMSAASDLSAFLPYQALYPPSSLFWVEPFSLLPWRVAISLWIVVSALLFIIAAFLMADLCKAWPSPVPIVVIAVFVVTSTLLLTTAQPSSPAISLCAIGVWCLVRNRLPVAGILCFALSITLKPQLGGPILLYFLLAPGLSRRRAWKIAAVTLLLCLPGIIRASTMPESSHWVHDLRANLAGTAAQGKMNDPGPTSYNSPLVTDLQSVVSVFRDVPSFYNPVTFAVVGSLMAIWAFIALRAQPSLAKDLLGVATIACLCLLPIYHRHYDVRLLLLTLPAMGMLFNKGGIRGTFALALSIAVICGSHPTFIRDHLHLHQETLGPMKTVLLLRTSPLTVLASGAFYLYCFAQCLRRETPPIDTQTQPKLALITN